MKPSQPASRWLMGAGITAAALAAAVLTAHRLSTPANRQATAPKPDTALQPGAVPEARPDASSAPIVGKARLPGAPDWKIQTFRTGSASPWRPEMAVASVSGADVHSFPHAHGHYTADIDSRGVTLRFGNMVPPETAPLTLSLKTPPETRESKPRGADGRVEIRRGDTLTEWYRNTPQGVEQGFTLGAPPERERNRNGIRLELELPETWTAVADTGSTSIRFRERANGTEVLYRNLMAYDAAGQRLPARMEPLAGGGGVALHASDAGAVYPVTIDPLFTVVTAARLGTTVTLTTGDQDPVILGGDLVFPLFNAVNSTSLGLWRAPLTGLHDPVRISDLQLSRTTDKNTGILQGVLNHQLHISAADGGALTLAENGDGLDLLKEAGGGGPFLAVESGQAWYLRGQELWRTDGTAAGTVRVRTLAFPPQPYALMRGGTLYYTSAATGGSQLNFSASDESFGTLLPPTPGLTLFKAVTIGDRIFLASTASGLHVTDGTAAGTRRLAESVVINEYGGITALGAFLYFRRDNDMWRTDGSPEGTVLVKGPHLHHGRTVAFKGSLYFSAGGSLFRSDGTEEGTVLFKANADIASDGDGSLFYIRAATDNEGEELWVSDGTEEGTRLLRDITPGPASTTMYAFRHAGKHIIFTTGSELWRSDGTPAGTMPLVDPSWPDSDVTGAAAITPAGGRVFFTAGRPATGTELWTADPATGTATGLEINPGTASSNPYQLKAFGEGQILFFATGAETGTGLWRSDGTVQGTVLVKALSSTSFPNVKPTELLVTGGTAWFIGPDSFGNIALNRTDGTPDGTVPVLTLPSWQQTAPIRLVPFGEGVAFLAPAVDGAPDTAVVWTSDGTAAGTVSVAGAQVYVSLGPILLTSSGKLFLQGRAPVTTWDPLYGIWAFSGSPPTPQRIIGISADILKLWFSRDGQAFYTAGTTAYKSDGTAAGTVELLSRGVRSLEMRSGAGRVLIEEIVNPDPNAISRLSAINPDHPADPAVDFNSATHNPPLGNPASPFHSSATVNFSPVQAGAYDFFRASGSPLSELWISDGTNAGTVPVPDAGTHISDLTSDGDRLYYLANNPVLGTRLRMLTLSASLTVTASPLEGGTVTGGLTGATEPGLKPVTATPAPGYVFSRWEGAGVTDPHAASTTVNMQGPATVTAVFEKQGSPSVIADWAAAYGLTGPQADPLADPAGDGVGNLLKYSFNLSPLVPASYLHSPSPSAGLPVITREHTETGGALRLEFLRRKSGTVSCAAQISTDLATWTDTTAAPVVESVDADWERVTISEPLPPGTERTFGRVRVKLN